MKESTKQGYNCWHSIEDLPMSNEQKEIVLEFLARKYWKLLLDLDIQDGHSKSYDPLLIEGNTAHSYVFNFQDGGRHHTFENLAELEKMMDEEILLALKET